MKCPDCGSKMDLEDDVFTCPYCGTEVPDPRVKISRNKTSVYKRVDVYNHNDDDDDEDTNSGGDRDVRLILIGVFVLIVIIFVVSIIASKWK